MNINIRDVHKGWKWLFGIIGILAVIYIILQLSFNVFFSSYFKQELVKAVNKSTRGTYLLKLDDLDLNLVSGNVTLSGLSIHPDSSSLQSSLYWKQVPVRGSLSARQLSIQQADLWKLYFSRVLTIGSIEIKQPNIDLTFKGNSAKSENQAPTKNINELFYDAAKEYVQFIDINRFVISNASIKAGNEGPEETHLSVDHADLTLMDIRVDSASAQSSNFFLTNHIQLLMEDIEWQPDSSLYSISTGSLGFNTQDQSAFVRDFSLNPKLPKHDFAKRIGVETDRVELDVPVILLNGIKTDSIFYRKSLIANKLSLGNPRADIFRDKKLPGPYNHRPQLLHMTFKNMKLPVAIDTVSISQGYVTYSEQQPEMNQPGIVSFEPLQAHITNATNMPHRITENPEMIMQTTTTVMGKGELKAKFTFPMDQQNGFHTIEGSLTDLPATALNAVTEKIAYVRAESGYIHSMNFSMTLTNDASAGELTMDYENLKISVLGKNSDGTQKTKGLKSFLANALKIKNSNHEKPLRKGTITFERDKSKSAFNYWWKSLLSGMKESIGI